MSVDVFGNPVPDGLSGPAPQAGPPQPPPQAQQPPAPQGKQQAAKQSSDKQYAQPATATSYKEMKATAKKAFKEGIQSGAGDEVANMLKKFLHMILMAPYDIMNYSLISFMLLSKSGKRKFMTITAIVIAVFSVACLVLLVGELNLVFAFYIAGALIACMLVLMGMSLEGTPPSSKKKQKHKPKPKSKKKTEKKPKRDAVDDLGDIYIE